MREKHIILRGTRFATHGMFPGAVAATRSGTPAFTGAPTPDFAGVTIELDDIDRRQVEAIAGHQDVLAVAPVMPMRLIRPVDLGNNNPAQPAAENIAWGIKAVGADTSPFTGEGIVVAVLDTGIDSAHPAFAGMELIEQDFTGEGNGDQNGHGTHCAGTIFGRTTGGVRIGVAPGVRKALIGKVLGNGGGSSDSIVSAMHWAIQNGANVISMSLGIDFPGFVRLLVEKNGLELEAATSFALEGYRLNVNLFQQMGGLVKTLGAFTQPAIIVAAAGNESNRPKYEIAVSPPAVSDGFISVAALGEGAGGLAVAPFSNTGANIAGPGVRIVSAQTGGGLLTLSGTSMATPHVAGVAALWAEKLKAGGPWTALQLTGFLTASATTAGLAPDIDRLDIGAGLVRAPQQ